MTTTTTLKAPFPYFGGKLKAASLVWQLLGDPGSYIEPFCGSAAILLNRPPFTGHRHEIINDKDGLLVNTWRALQHAPQKVLQHCQGPFTEIDKHARAAWLKDHATPEFTSWLEGHPEHYDAKVAGWWLMVTSCSIGNPLHSGPWIRQNGKLCKHPNSNGITREKLNLGNTGKGVGSIRFMTQPEAMLTRLSNRLRGVKITCGNWQRVLTPTVTTPRSGGDGQLAIFLDPPYTKGDTRCYQHQDSTTAIEVQHWCTTINPTWRVILCGYDNEHDELLNHGWTKHQGKAGSSGYSTKKGNHLRERFWTSPECITPSKTLFNH